MYCQVKGVYWAFTRKRPVGMVMQSVDNVVPGAGPIEAFTWYDLPWAMGTHESADALLEREVDVTDPDSFDPEIHGMALVAAQRARPAINLTPGIEEGHCRIGGEVQVTEVRKSGVRTITVGEFPDKVGQRIAA